MRKLFTFLLIICVFHQSISQTVFKFDFTGYTGTPPTLFASTGSATLNHNGLANFFEDACTGQGFAANGWDTNDYIQIQTSTVGFVGPFSFGFDYRMSSIDLGNFDIRVSTDGNSFNTIGNLNATGPTAGCNAIVPSILSTAYNNQPNLYIRIYKLNDAVTALNRLRLDNITLQATALPVELTYFQTQATDNQKVSIKWETATEINSSYFVLERSRDAVNYKAIANIEAAGSSTSKKTYSFTDESALFGTNYYRLSQIDRDGTKQVFRPQAVVIDDAYVAFGVFPNPSIGTNFNVKVEDVDEANVSLMDFSGRVINLNINKLTQTIFAIIPSETLNFGTYFLEVKTLGSLKKHKILILK
jgi:Secretion system C-terminal sorting domain